MSIKLKVKVKERWFSVELEEEDIHSEKLNVYVDGEEVEVHIGAEETSSSADLSPRGTAKPEVSRATVPDSSPSAVKTFSSPMPGMVISVAVEVGDQVVTGDAICVLEAMKMQQTLRADWSGIVKNVCVKPGEQVSDGATIVELE